MTPCTIETHRVLKSSPLWSTLRLVGYQRDADYPEDDLELRDCPCGSTLARPVAASVGE